jgi:hypothetical protein
MLFGCAGRTPLDLQPAEVSRTESFSGVAPATPTVSLGPWYCLQAARVLTPKHDKTLRRLLALQSARQGATGEGSRCAWLVTMGVGGPRCGSLGGGGGRGVGSNERRVERVQQVAEGCVGQSSVSWLDKG